MTKLRLHLPADYPARLIGQQSAIRIDETQRVVYVLRFWHAKRNPQSWRPEC